MAAKINHSKDEITFWGMLYLVWVWNQNGGGTYFSYFSRSAYVQPSFKTSRQELSIDVAEQNIGLCWKITKLRTTPVLGSYPKQV